jgi:hypothetical protein
MSLPRMFTFDTYVLFWDADLSIVHRASPPLHNRSRHLLSTGDEGSPIVHTTTTATTGCMNLYWVRAGRAA